MCNVCGADAMVTAGNRERRRLARRACYSRKLKLSVPPILSCSFFQFGSTCVILGTAPRGRPVRRHHDRDGRHCRRRHLYQPVRRRPATAHANADIGCVDSGRRGRDPGSFRLCRAGCSPSSGRRPVRVPARGVSSRRRISLWMGAVAGHPDRRYGGRDGNVCALPVGADGLANLRAASGRAHDYPVDHHQLPGCEGRQPGAKRPDVAEDPRHRGIDRRGAVSGPLAASVAASGPGSTAVCGSVDGRWGGDGPGTLCLRRLANHQLHRRGDQRSAKEPVTSAGDGRSRSHRCFMLE